MPLTDFDPRRAAMLADVNVGAFDARNSTSESGRSAGEADDSLFSRCLSKKSSIQRVPYFAIANGSVLHPSIGYLAQRLQKKNVASVAMQG